VEHVPPRTEPRKPGGTTSSTFADIEWLIVNHGSVTIGDIGANVGCVAAAADQHLCYGMLAQRAGESLRELGGRLERAIASADETSVTIGEINPPGAFKPRKEPKSRRP
jgi:hypothetical protein